MNTKQAAIPAHVLLSEPIQNPRDRPGVRGQSLRLDGQYHNFVSLIPLYGASFTERILDAFARTYVHATGTTTYKRGQHLRQFLNYLATEAADKKNHDTPVGRTFRGFVEGQHQAITSVQWRDTVESYASRLRNLDDQTVISTRNKLSRQNRIESLSATLRDLAKHDLWPTIDPLRGIPHYDVMRGQRIPSLGELKAPGAVSNSVASHSATFAMITELSRARLARLRELFENILIEEEAAFDARQSLLSLPEQPSLADIDAAVRLLPPSYGIGSVDNLVPPVVQRCFPTDDHNRRLSSLLRYIKWKYEGYFPVRKITLGLQQLFDTCDGMEKVMSHFEGGGRALMAAYSLVMIDSGINIQPCDQLAADPFTAKAQFGKLKLTRVSSVKNRARHKPIDGYFLKASEDSESPNQHETEGDESIELPIAVANARISGVEAIKIWQKISRPQRDYALAHDEKTAKYLWILRNNVQPKHVKRYTHSRWHVWWQSFLQTHSSDPIIGGLPIQRRMIRTTVIQLRAVLHDSDAETVALLSEHNNSRTAVRHYLNRPDIKHLLDQRVREFQNLLEASLVGDNPARANQLGLASEVLTQRQQTAVETGRGFTDWSSKASVPSAWMLPSAGSRSPARMWSKVDLPTPLRPTIPTR